MLSNFGQIVDKEEIMKIFKEELKKEAKRIIKTYFEQIVPDEAKMSDLIRDVIIRMVKK